MKSVRTLVAGANPVPPVPDSRLSADAADRLAKLVGPGPAETMAAEPASPPLRRRWGGPVVVVAAVAAAGLVAVGVLLLNGADGGGGIVADEPYHATTADLEESADLIVTARLGPGRAEGTDGARLTVADAEVLAEAKGRAPAGGLEVSYTTPGSGPETADLRPGRPYVFLLERQHDGRFTLVNSVQGAYGVDGGRAVPGPDNHVRLSDGVLAALGLTR
ncbi:hypothetical protein QNO07_04780 [Streptomyces sp. 549]|uniref:hypothetical protein n=1 Tax=Streptomyces sp. 549 TaxID=3049076 RepID=UPI0024C2F61C|nr:hypothetical protein [Streptomyces sp. 549]MDK1472748.1 hypothetical protein [Streptomyces sp. 549]